MIKETGGRIPSLHPECYIAENASLIGDVIIGAHSSIWYGAVLRGDHGTIRIGERCSVQDNVTIHEETRIGDDVTIGHNAVLHGCTIASGCLIGMGAVILNDAEIGEGSIVAASCLIPSGTIIPPGSLVMGVPGKCRGTVTKERQQELLASAADYITLARAQLPRAEDHSGLKKGTDA